LVAQNDIRTGLLQLRWLLAAEAVQAKGAEVARLLRAKYDPDQPRVPAGNPEGGRWTDAEGGLGANTEAERSSGRASEPRIQVAARRLSPGRAAECDRQYRRDVFQCRMVGLPACYAQAMVRLVACQQGTAIPPLNY
jgi:hypothetical protein